MNFIYAFCSFIFYFNASFIKNDIEMIMTTIQNILSRIRTKYLQGCRKNAKEDRCI